MIAMFKKNYYYTADESGCEISRGLKYAISKYGNICKWYISLLMLPGLMKTLLKEWEWP